jgi:propanol-preferring alcohol dehydrogenase
MKAMRLHAQAPIDDAPLTLEDVERPVPERDEVLVRVEACGICRTDLHVVEGDLAPTKMPIIPGHQIVGIVEDRGADVTDRQVGERVGIAWLRSTDGTCTYCLAGRENLCLKARFTGYMENGGYAEYATARADFTYRIPDGLEPVEAAPFLCAGIIGYRALRRSDVKPGQRLGIVGFGASAHVTMQVARFEGCKVLVATRGDRHRALARDMGADWVGERPEDFPSKLDAAIIFAPVGELVPPVLEQLDRGGTLALAGIYMTDIPALDYERHLFYERSARSVTANTRQDGRELFQLATEIPIHTHTEVFPLAMANQSLQRLKHDQIMGAGVLLVG